MFVQGASLIKGKIFSSGSFDSSVNDVHGTKRFNVGGFGERKERACKVRRDIIYPQKARNSQGDYLFIVNQDNFRQAVEVLKDSSDHPVFLHRLSVTMATIDQVCLACETQLWTF